MATVTVIPSGRTFACEGRQSILEAALAASVALNYGCSSGTCGLCIGRLKRGEIEKIRHHDFPVKDADRLQGDFPLCSYTAASTEVVVEAAEATGSVDIPWQRIEARLRKIQSVSDDISIITVQTPRTCRLRFLPGQNVCLSLPDGASMDLPIASCPCDDRNIAFHLRSGPAPGFSSAVLEPTSLPTPVLIEGPWGPTPAGTTSETTLCLAYDISIAPLLSWIEQQLADDSSRTISVYWCTPDETDFYLKHLLSAWRDAFDTFDFHLLVADDPSRIPRAIENRLTDEMSPEAGDSRVLVAGPEAFAYQLRSILEGVDFPESRLYIHSTSRPP